jgi:hypothetical protein
MRPDRRLSSAPQEILGNRTILECAPLVGYPPLNPVVIAVATFVIVPEGGGPVQPSTNTVRPAGDLAPDDHHVTLGGPLSAQRRRVTR